LVEYSWQVYLTNKSSLNEKDTLYRLFKRNPIKIWQWGDYLFSKKYYLPYKNWNEIKQIRGYINHKSGYQDF
jgi:hypothetical protein